MKYFIYLFVLILFGCKEYISKSIYDVEKTCVLLEPEDSVIISDTNIGNASDIVIFDDNSIMLTDGINIYKVLHNGKISNVYNKQGHSKSEYLRIGNMYISDNYIYIWCNMTLKLLQYDMEMNFINSYNGPNVGISCFHVENDSLAYFYLSGSVESQVCELNLIDREITEYGAITKEDQCLHLSSNCKALGFFSNSICYSNPSNMTIYDIINNREITIKDKFFSVDNVADNIFEKRDPTLLFDYISNNSICTLLCSNKDYSFFVTETGCYSKPSNERKINIFILDKEDKMSAISFAYPSRCLRYFINGNNFYYLKDSEEGGMKLFQKNIISLIKK